MRSPSATDPTCAPFVSWQVCSTLCSTSLFECRSDPMLSYCDRRPPFEAFRLWKYLMNAKTFTINFLENQTLFRNVRSFQSNNALNIWISLDSCVLWLNFYYETNAWINSNKDLWRAQTCLWLRRSAIGAKYLWNSRNMCSLGHDFTDHCFYWLTAKYLLFTWLNNILVSIVCWQQWTQNFATERLWNYGSAVRTHSSSQHRVVAHLGWDHKRLTEAIRVLFWLNEWELNIFIRWL